jgi:cell division protein FtsQ
MSKDTIALPETRTWRDIPQQVKPRAMSPEGRRRVVVGAIRATIGTVVLAIVTWASWETFEVFRGNPASQQARSDRIRSLVLVTDGVLDKAWLNRTLALPSKATLMGLDLQDLRRRLMADAQVASASVIRIFPDTLTVRISERSPVARLMAQAAAGSSSMLLVSRDGAAFAGTGFDPAVVGTLPWIDGVTLVRRGAGFAPLPGMEAVGDLLASAKLEAENLYRAWQVVSLARLATDGEIDVQTRQGTRIVFSAREDYLRQIAKLDLVFAEATDPTKPLREVNLALGSQVPVTYGSAAPTLAEAAPFFGRPSLTPSHPSLSTLHLDIHREP